MNTPDRLHEDEAARRRALDPVSFIVEAPAGAGKTELLTQRYLALLARVEHPEEVVALTFTNKAATEMRDRILGSLDLAAGGEPPPEKHKQVTFALANEVLARDHALGWGLRSHPGRLRITTLDALCASLARQMPFLSRFGAQPGVATDASAHYQRAARLTLDLLEGSDAAADIVADALAFMDNDAGRLERLIIAMLGRREQWLEDVTRLTAVALRAEVERGFRHLVERDLATALALCTAFWQQRLMPLARLAVDHAPGAFEALRDWAAPLSAEVADLPRWQALADLLLTKEGGWRRTVNKNQGFPATPEGKARKEDFLALIDELAAIAGLEEALHALRGLPDPVFGDEDWTTIENFAQLLKLATGQLWLVFQEAGEVDFGEIADRAVRALGDDDTPTELAQALDYRIQHLLVDEFQDTSPLQVRLLARLTRGWQADDGRTLFLVGDPMQSIYRFRKAEVGLFLQVRAQGIGDVRLENLRLFRNNRSYPGIVDWVNTAFPGIFPADDAPDCGAVRYADCAATRSAVADSAVSFHPVLARDGVDTAAAEARLMLELVRATWQARPTADIAVLVRARTHLDALVAELRRSAPDIRFQAVEIEGLADRQHIADLLSLQHALWHRADRVHWLAVLRAPWCGLTLADLHALAGDDHQATVWQLMQRPERVARLSPDGQARLHHVREVFTLAFAERGRQSPRRWLEGVWLMLGAPAALAPEALADVAAFFALLDELAASGQLDSDTLPVRAAELFAPPDPQATGRLQLMTIHKSKGLEFDTVIIPGLDRTSGHNDSPLLLWDTVADDHGVPHLLVAPIARKGASNATPTPYDLLRRLEDRRTSHEDARLLYVGATRAIRRLHFTGVVDCSDKNPDGLATPTKGTLLSLLWAPLAAEASRAQLATAQDAAAGHPASLPADYAPPLIRLRHIAVPDEMRALPSHFAAPNPDVDIADGAPSLAAAVGTLVHRCLELIAQEGPAAWPAERLAAQQPALRRWLAGRGFGPEEVSTGTDEAARALATTLASEAGRWVLTPRPEAGAEESWSTGGDDGIAQHVIDRVFIEDGVRWIIDYKTLRGAGEADLPAAAASHRPQLQRYASLFADDPRPCRLAIYFPLQGTLVTLPA